MEANILALCSCGSCPVFCYADLRRLHDDKASIGITMMRGGESWHDVDFSSFTRHEPRFKRVHARACSLIHFQKTVLCSNANSERSTGSEPLSTTGNSTHAEKEAKTRATTGPLEAPARKLGCTPGRPVA